MKNKIIVLVFSFLFVTNIISMTVSAQTISGYNYGEGASSLYEYSVPSMSSYDYTAPTVSSYDYNAPVSSSYNYTSPTVSSYDYTSPTVSSYNYTSPDYTSPNYYTSPVYTSPTYVAPTYSTGNIYVAPTYSGYNYSNYTYPTYTYPTTSTTRCSDGTLPVNGSCNHVTTIPTTNTTICSNGSLPINGSCVRTNTIPTTNTTICSDGSLPINGSCVRTNTIPTTNTTICSDGTLPINGSCTRVVTAPVTTITNCPSNTNFINGACQQIINPPVVVYQTCWNGAVIPATATCAPQYKVCANGTSVPVNQACYVAPVTPVYVAPPVITFNNVVTSPVTQITNTTGRCNGIGLIANNVPSTGWFEYGETTNLGRTTASATIGSSATAPFSNMLANLKPSTKYYCRAVMQNQYGIFKGEIVGFTTHSTATTYVKPIVSTPTKAPVKSNVITCSDGSTILVKNTSAATLINKGEKLLAVQIEKIDGNLSSGEIVHYKVNYKNLIDTRLTGVVVKVTIPQEITFVGTSVGVYDEVTRTLTVNQDSIDPYKEGTITITGKLVQDAPVEKTIVTTVYALYSVPGTNTQDEVTAYTIGSIVPFSDISNKDTGAKHVIGMSDGRGFMPNSLIEWLALLAILFIIFILGRSIYASYKEDESSKH